MSSCEPVTNCDQLHAAGPFDGFHNVATPCQTCATTILRTATACARTTFSVSGRWNRGTVPQGREERREAGEDPQSEVVQKVVCGGGALDKAENGGRSERYRYVNGERGLPHAKRHECDLGWTYVLKI